MNSPKNGIWRERIKASLEKVNQNRRLLTFVVIVLLTNGVMICATDNSEVRARTILNEFQDLWGSIQKYQADETPEINWEKFASRHGRHLQEIVQELQKSASKQRPAHQTLLFIGRDHLQPLLSAASPPQPDSTESLVIERYLRVAKEQQSY